MGISPTGKSGKHPSKTPSHKKKILTIPAESGIGIPSYRKTKFPNINIESIDIRQVSKYTEQ